MAIKIGDSSLADCKIGDTQVTKIYLGDTLIWERGGGGGGGSVVKDGLICWLDGRDIDASTRVWSDRSGQNNAFNFRSAPTANGKSYIPKSSDRCYGTIAHTGDYSIEIYLKSNDESDGFKVALESSYGSDGSGLTTQLSTGVYSSSASIIGFFKYVVSIGNTDSLPYITNRVGSNSTGNLLISIVYSGTTCTVYFDGVQAYSNQFGANSDTWYIGSRDGDRVSTEALIHSVRFYNKALTQAEINTNLAAEKAVDRSV